MSNNRSIESEIVATYTDETGLDYAEQVLSLDEKVNDSIALSRTRKIQPYVKDSDKVLEVGVGIGTNLRRLNAAQRVGYDVGGFGREQCEAASIEFTTSLADLHDRLFSVVICHHVLEHVPAPVETLQVCYDHTELNGKLILCVPNDVKKRQRNYVKDDPNHHLYSWTPMTLGNLVTTVGYELEEIKVKPFGYEKALAPLGRINSQLYFQSLRMARLLRPSSEIFLIATKK